MTSTCRRSSRKESSSSSGRSKLNDAAYLNI